VDWGSLLSAQLGAIASTGVVGAFLVLSIYVNRMQGLENRRITEERLADWKEQSEGSKEMAVVLAEFTSTGEARNRLQDAASRSQDLSAAAAAVVATNVVGLSAEIKDLALKVERVIDLRNDIQRLIDTVARLDRGGRS
jgi:hypothetical protein